MLPDKLMADMGVVVRGLIARLAIKTLEQYRARLWAACVRLFNGGRDAAFEASFIRSIDQQLTKAWDEGAESIGVEPDEYTDADITIRDAIINNETEFINGLMNDIQTAKDSGMAREDFDKQFGSRADLWANRWTETVNRARMQMGSKQRFTWRLGSTEEHCDTCSRLNGITAFGYEWDEARIQPQAPPNSALTCSGWRCDCSLEPTTRRRTGRALDRLIEIRL